MSKEALRKFHMNLLNHCDEFLELNVDIRIIDDYALQLANELEQALTTDRTLEIVKKIKKQIETEIYKFESIYGKERLWGITLAKNDLKLLEKIISESEGTK